MTALDIAYGNGMNIGGLSSLSKNAQQRRAERQEAQELADAASRSSVDGKTEDTKLRGVAEEFVSVFMNQIMKSMRATVQENPEMHGDNGEKFFQQMLDQEYSSSMAKGSGYGLTDLVYQSLVSKARVQSMEESAPVADAAVTQEIPGVSEVGLQ